jgi:hypothetical protein
MFVQVIQGRVADAPRLRAAVDQWVRDVSPGATGWLGSTGGVTADGRFFALVRFESAEAAQRNSDRPEQDQWWKETSQLFTGEPTFIDSSDVTVEQSGDPDRAGFLQVMQGHTSDVERAKALMAEQPEGWEGFRPDVLGSVGVNSEGGAWTMAIYFTSEAAAREGEKKEPPPAVAAQMEELNKLSVGEMTFLDIADPWLHSPG